MQFCYEKRHVGAGLFSSLLSVVHQRVSSGALCTQSSRFAWMSVLRLSSYLLLQMVVSVATSSLPVKWRAQSDHQGINRPLLMLHHAELFLFFIFCVFEYFRESLGSFVWS